MRDNDLPVGEVTVFLASLFVNLAIAVVHFVVLGGRALTSRRIDPEDALETNEERSDKSAGAGGSAKSGGAAKPAPSTTTETATEKNVSVAQIITPVAFLVVAVVALLPIIIPIAVPLIVAADRPDTISEETFYRQILAYSELASCGGTASGRRGRRSPTARSGRAARAA